MIGYLSFALFAKGGMPLLCTRGPSPHILLIPPFAKSAKDRHPIIWFWREREKIVLDGASLSAVGRPTLEVIMRL
jgi:hypothetical protein